MFKGKKVTVMGLGLLGRGVGDIKFLAEEGAELIVTDLKTKEQLQESLEELSENKIGEVSKNITFVLGEHRLEDFRGRDFILKAASVPLDSIYIREAEKNTIPIEMSAALFTVLTSATVIGVTGTRGKSTVTYALHAVIEHAVKQNIFPNCKKVFLGGNIRGVSTLPFLREAKMGDIAVLELDSWQLQGFGYRKISPHIAIFTTLFPDHMNYYKQDPSTGRTGMDVYLADKANIFKFQDEKDFLVMGTQVSPLIEEKYGKEIISKKITADALNVPSEWVLKIPGEHNRYNAGIVVEAARALAIPDEITKEALESFTSVPGRLEFIAEKRGVKIYNDNNATTPEATIAALKAFGDQKNILLIFGGTDKNLDMSSLITEIQNHCKVISFYKETGTDNIKEKLFALKNMAVIETETFEESIRKAFEMAQPGDILLFSPAFASFGRFFKNEYDRGEQFNDLIIMLS